MATVGVQVLTKLWLLLSIDFYFDKLQFTKLLSQSLPSCDANSPAILMLFWMYSDSGRVCVIALDSPCLHDTIVHFLNSTRGNFYMWRICFIIHNHSLWRSSQSNLLTTPPDFWSSQFPCCSCSPTAWNFLPANIRPYNFCSFYRAMHFSAKRGIAIACRLSVCPSVSLSMTLVDCDHIGWNSSKIISPIVSLGWSLFATPTWRVCSKGEHP